MMMIIIIILKQEDVYLAEKKTNFICKYQRILSGITNHLHDHEEFLSITSVITSR